MFKNTKAYAQCMYLVTRICRRPGGTQVLLEKLTELERQTGNASALARCGQCGSTDLEPTTATHSGDTHITQFRCRACGAEVSAP